MPPLRAMLEPLAGLALALLVGWCALMPWIYLPVPQAWACTQLPRCAALGGTAAERRDELIAYFRHQRQVLPQPWTARERAHLGEVRRIYDRAWVVAAGLTLALAIGLGLKTLRPRRIAAWGLLWLAPLWLAIPFFAGFWRDWLHPLLFANELWKNTPAEVSYHLLPRGLFRLALASTLLLTSVSLLFLALWPVRPEALPVSGRA